MPLLTMASAISRTILSLTWLRNLFQLFQPIGGVLARPFDFTGSGIGSETGAGRGGSGLGVSVETRLNSTTCGWPPRPPREAAGGGALRERDLGPGPAPPLAWRPGR